LQPVYIKANTHKQGEERKMAYVITEKCEKCGVCVDVCPTEAISEGDPIYKIDPDLCSDCGVCADECPTDAIIPGE
jgi:ferredoxin